jgi:hypothetical protein
MPLNLKRPGAASVAASSIFLTTANNVASMKTRLGLATTLVTQVMCNQRIEEKRLSRTGPFQSPYVVLENAGRDLPGTYREHGLL